MTKCFYEVEVNYFPVTTDNIIKKTHLITLFMECSCSDLELIYSWFSAPEPYNDIEVNITKKKSMARTSIKGE